MTTHTHPTTGRPASPRAAYTTRDHLVVGTATQLANLVTNHRDAGTLVALTAPRPVTGDRIQVVLRLRERATSRPATRVMPVGEHTRTRVHRSRHARLTVIATAVTGALAGLTAAAAYLLGQLVDLITAHAGLILAVLTLAAITAGLLTRGTGRRHCPGC